MIIRRDRLTPIRQHQTPQHSTKKRQGGFRLVVGNLVPGFVDAHEAEVAVLPHFAVLFAVDHEGDVACFAEFGGVRVVYFEGERFAAEPVADVVCKSRVSRYSLRGVRWGFGLRRYALPASP